MAIDQRDVSSTLRFMDDRALQQYAAMHKNDPYIFPLAFQESQNRQKIRMSQQTAQAMQPQPKVNEQALAQMAPQPMPEEQGIGALPAGNMETMADGGIAGYPDDDFVTRNQSVVMMAGGGHVQGYDRGGAIKANPEFLRFLKQVGGDYVDFANAPDADKAALLEMFERYKSGAPSAAPTSATPTTTTAAAAPEEPRRLRKISERVGGLGSTAVKTARKFTPAGLGIEALTSMGDYKTQAPDGIDTSLAGTASDLLRGEFGRAGTGLVRGLGEAAADVGSFGANVLDYVVPGKAPVSTAYEKFLADNTNLQGPRARAVANVPPAPSGSDIRSQLNRADAAVYAQPGVDNAPVAAGPSTGAAPSAAPSSVLSSSTLANTSGGRGGPSAGAGAASSGLRDEKGIASLYGNLLKSQQYVDPAKGEVDKLAQEQLATATRRKQEYDAFVAKQGDVYKDRSDRLVEREKGIGKQVDQNMGLALLNAGLAIMSTPGSLATAIGKGAQVGTAQFAAGLDKINLARDRLADAKDKLEDLRMNRDEMTFKQRSALEAEIDKAQIDARKMSIDGIRAAAGVTEKRAETLLSKVLDAEKTSFEQREQTRRTLATINASNDGRTKQLWAGLMQKHGNDPVAAAKEYNAIEAGDKPTQAAEKMVQDRVSDWEKSNKTVLALMKPEERTAEIRKRTDQFRNDIYTQLKLTPTMGAGASGDSRFKLLGVTPTQ